MPAAGKSLWPLLLDGDSLRVERCRTVAPGDVAVVVLGGVLVAHVVVSVAPLRTAATNGRVDPPADELLGRVIAFRRAGLTVPWPRGASKVLRWWPKLARGLRGVPGTRWLIHRLRDRR